MEAAAFPSDLVARLRPLLVEVEQDILAAARADPALADDQLDQATERNLRIGARAAIEQFLAQLEHPGQTVVWELFFAHGRAQRHAGRRLDEMLGFYRLGLLTVWRRLAPLSKEHGIDSDTLARLSDAIFSFGHELSAAVSRGYAEADHTHGQALAARRAELFALIAPEPAAAIDAVERLARITRWPLDRPVTVAVTDLDPADSGVAHHELLTGPVCGRLGLVMAADHAQWQLDRLCRLRPSRTLARSHATSWREIPAALRRAHTALAAHPNPPAGEVIDADADPVLGLLASDLVFSKRLTRSRLAPLDALGDDERARMLATLAGWLDHPGRPQLIADQLDIHVQTVRYRLRRLRQLLGPALDDPRARLELALALHGRDIL